MVAQEALCAEQELPQDGRVIADSLRVCVWASEQDVQCMLHRITFDPLSPRLHAS